jgi:hypothetical protein
LRRARQPENFQLVPENAIVTKMEIQFGCMEASFKNAKCLSVPRLRPGKMPIQIAGKSSASVCLEKKSSFNEKENTVLDDRSVVMGIERLVKADATFAKPSHGIKRKEGNCVKKKKINISDWRINSMTAALHDEPEINALQMDTIICKKPNTIKTRFQYVETGFKEKDVNRNTEGLNNHAMQALSRGIYKHNINESTQYKT